MCQVVLDSSLIETTLRGSARGVSAPISQKCESRHGRRLHISDGGGGNTRAIHGARPRCARASLRPSEIAPGDFVEPPAGVSLLCLPPNKKARTRRAFLFGGAGAIKQTTQCIDPALFSTADSWRLPPKLPATRRDADLWDPGSPRIPIALTSYRSDQMVKFMVARTTLFGQGDASSARSFPASCLVPRPSPAQDRWSSHFLRGAGL